MKQTMYTMNMKKIFIVGLIIASGIIMPSSFAFSADSTSGGITGGSAPSSGISTKLQNPIKYDTFSKFAAGVTEAAVKILLPFIVIGFMYSGFLFVKAQGNEKELEEAKKAIWYSMIGAFILLGAWGFAQIIGQTVSTITNTSL